MFTLSVIIISCLAVVVAIFLMQCWFEERYGDLATRWVLPKEIIQGGSVILFVGLSLYLGLKVCASLNRDAVMIAGFGIGLSALWGAWWIVMQDARRPARCLWIWVRLNPKAGMRWWLLSF